MHIHTRKDWELSESVVTPEALYRNRRNFLKAVGLGAAGWAFGGSSLLAATAGFSSTPNPHYLDAGLKVTPYDLITSYNNFYEFGLDKADPKVNANKGWKTDPWTVEIAGLVRNPLKLDVSDLVAKMGG
ncbi:MAG TPA: hypothetical protein PLN52_25955, partial [Opitutaceae bacterium]|nr:hypothetical protein [Opitutaceae bacterium]